MMGRRGALLLELLLGMGIFATALLLAFGVFPSSQRATGQTREFNFAHAIARQTMEYELATNNYGGLASRAMVFVPRTMTSNGQSIVLNYEVTVDVVETDTTPFHRKDVRVVVRWAKGTSSDKHEVVYETWVAE